MSQTSKASKISKTPIPTVKGHFLRKNNLRSFSNALIKDREEVSLPSKKYNKPWK
jgi:hypothetical protein